MQHDESEKYLLLKASTHALIRRCRASVVDAGPDENRAGVSTIHPEALPG